LGTENVGIVLSPHTRKYEQVPISLLSAVVSFQFLW
jgi:hypothetical protein